MLKRLGRSPAVQRLVGTLAAEYLRFVYRTSRFTLDPPDAYERVDRDWPPILTVWHGQHFLLPFLKRPKDRVRVLISQHRDGEINALVARRLGVEAVRGSGDTTGRNRKGGASGFRSLMTVLESGMCAAMTADVPKVSRRAGLGIVKLAQKSGRPIVPVAIATNRRTLLDTWDRSAVDKPFSRGVFAFGEFVRVPREADEAALEAARQALEASLNEATVRAETRMGVYDG